MIKDKTEYMKQLEQLLLWDYSSTAVREILEDYEEFFNDGIINGKSEEEICEALGRPETVVKELLAGSDRKESEKSNSKLILRGGLICLILIVFSLHSLLGGYKVYYIKIMIRLVPLFMVFIWKMLDGRMLMDSMDRKDTKLKAGIFACLAFITFVSYIIAYIVSNLYSSMYVHGMLRYRVDSAFPATGELKQIAESAHMYSFACFLIMILLIIMTAYLIILIRKKSVLYFGLLFLVIGIWGGMLVYCNIFSDYVEFLSLQSLIGTDINKFMITVAAGSALISILFWGYSIYIANKQKELH